jgi:hypothetical protein
VLFVLLLAFANIFPPGDLSRVGVLTGAVSSPATEGEETAGEEVLALACCSANPRVPSTGHRRRASSPARSTFHNTPVVTRSADRAATSRTASFRPLRC